jgi:2-desacetyl-2-hydroxyethyl bacteriochlorophyllide A dehydrogenase
MHQGPKPSRKRLARSFEEGFHIKMKAVWLENQKLRYREDIPMPEPKADEALIRVLRAGICGTDLQLLKGYYPFCGIPGHEFVGEIVKAPAEPRRKGQRVVSEINISCGECPSCLAGRSTHCENRTVVGIKKRNGAFAEYVCVPLVNLFSVSDTVSDDAALFVEPLAAALEFQAQIPVGAKDHVLLLGAGKLGQLIARGLKPSGAALKVVARYEKQQNLLRQYDIEVIDEHAITRSAFDIVIEATGSPEGFFLAQTAVRPRGTMVLKSTYKGETQINLSSIVVDEISLVGSRCGPFAPALALIESGQVDTAGLIEARYSLADALKAFDHSTRPGALKVIFEMG